MNATLEPKISAAGAALHDFWWQEFDVTHLLPPDWVEQIQLVAALHQRSRTLISASVTSREIDQATSVPVMTVGGGDVARELPWLVQLYRNEFRALGQTLLDEPVTCADEARIAINLNIQRGVNMRYECHVDSNPLEGLLYVTTHTPEEGGELVVAKSPEARGVDAINADAWRIHPVSGRLVFFDAREFPHYVASLRDDDAVRIVCAMNFYTPSCPETARPADLNRHLFGTN